MSGMRALAENAGEEEEGIIGHGKAFLQAGGAQTDQIEQMMGEAIALAAHVWP